MGALMSKKDEIIMSLVHYFITEENYTPIIVKGAKDEIWLENLDGPYKVIRLNSNHIHNVEQFDYDILKTKGVLRQIKHKTFSMSVNILNIYLDINSIPDKDIKHMDMLKVDSIEDVKENKLLNNIFKKIDSKLSTETIDLDNLISKTEDVNKETEKKNKVFENIFKKKSIIINYIIMMSCILYFSIVFIKCNGNLNAYNLLLFGANERESVQNGEWYRLFSSIFLHGSILHLVLNMYSLKIVGEQVENYFGKLRFITIFLISGLCGSLFSLIFTNSVSIGASGAIFGLLGSLLYFTYNYRLVLGSTFKNQVLPVIILNLFLSLLIPNVDFYAHLGGLIAGIFATMAVGIPGKKDNQSMINGSICLLLMIGFLSYIVFFYI